ncbi:hypothetical protein [Amycolatopsis benzoatilytica]|uniref:hypothetical protein n=1 Tax=Amycolatopsis benzoatilytica TaxID=346045 RepID=UPI00037DA201|nr:hypothetical protein [Amycolatopsis benzoatilytica]
MDVILDSPLTVAIVACEIGFWLFIAAGLVTRYALRKPKAGAVLLTLVPVVDLVLLVVTVLDLLDGATPSAMHGLAAVYLGFSVVFGPSMVRWADVRFAHRFSGGPAPVKPAGAAKARHEWREWAKCVLACAISAGLLLLAILIVGNPEQAAPLWGWLPQLGAVIAVWFLAGPLWQQVFGSSRKKADVSERKEDARR